ncbi:DUF1957 domain-containing protein, partial [bacterium]|nr:DUF1957 domain-containing protein [bacterium]
NSDIYNLEQAKSLAKIQAQSFIENRLRQLKKWPSLPHPPLVTLSLNAEFLGSTWSEGCYWLEQILRLAADKAKQLRVTTPDKFAQYSSSFPLAVPNSSSWLDGGFAERLINNSNNWVINYINISNKHFYEMAKTSDPTPLQVESINQALRELLLAQSSDWPLMLSVGENSTIARKKLRNYLIAFNKLYEDFLDGRVDIESLRSLQSREPIFEGLDYRQFFRQR